jgi:hypothetical protein
MTGIAMRRLSKGANRRRACRNAPDTGEIACKRVALSLTMTEESFVRMRVRLGWFLFWKTASKTSLRQKVNFFPKEAEFHRFEFRFSPGRRS